MNSEMEIKLSEAAQKEFKDLDRQQKEELVKGLRTTHNYIDQVVRGYKIVGAVRAQKIEKILKRPGLAARIRPDIFGGSE